MEYKFEGSQLHEMLKKMGEADLQILAAELLPAIEEVVNELSPASVQAGEKAVEELLNPALQSGIQALVAKVKL